MPHDANRELLDAVARGELKDVQRTVEAGADVNARDGRGETVLMRAVRRADSEIVQCLVEHGADVAAQDRAGRTALEYLTFPPEPPEHWENEHEAWTHSEESYIAAYLARVGATRSRATTRARAGAPPTPEPAVGPAPRSAPPAQPPSEGPHGRRASGLDWLLFAAIQRGALADVEGILATDKVNINARDDGGWTPLMRATALDDLEILRLLLKNGADPTIKAEDGVTALGLASPQAKAVFREFLRTGR